MRPLSNVQVLRGVAASLVVLFHLWEELGQRNIPNAWPDMTFGAFGVDVFFVVSGFIMIYATAPAFGTIRAAVPFFLRRLARIVPLYWAVTTVYVLFMVRTKQDPGYSAPFLGASYLFVPYPEPGDGAYFPAYSLGWTLQYEMLFYVCLSGVMVLRRTTAVVALGMALSALVVAGRLSALPWPFDSWASSQVLEFVFGMILAEARLRGLLLPGRVCLALALSGIVAAVASAPSLDAWFAWRGLVWGGPAAALTAAAVFHGPSRTGRVRRALERLGDAAYSLYLVHYLMFVLVARALQHVFTHPERAPASVYATLLAAVSVGAALLSYRWFERPVTRFLQSRLSRTLSRDRDAASPRTIG